MMLAGFQSSTHAGKEEVPAGGVVTGIGQVHGRAVAIVANDATGRPKSLEAYADCCSILSH